MMHIAGGVVLGLFLFFIVLPVLVGLWAQRMEVKQRERESAEWERTRPEREAEEAVQRRLEAYRKQQEDDRRAQEKAACEAYRALRDAVEQGTRQAAARKRKEPYRSSDDPFSVEEIEAEFARLLGRRLP
jgi:FtsZ-interacting cell division protein ZipA